MIGPVARIDLTGRCSAWTRTVTAHGNNPYPRGACVDIDCEGRRITLDPAQAAELGDWLRWWASRVREDVHAVR